MIYINVVKEITGFNQTYFSGATVQQVKQEEKLTDKLQNLLLIEPLIDSLSGEVQRLRRMHSARAS